MLNLQSILKTFRTSPIQQGLALAALTLIIGCSSSVKPISYAENVDTKAKQQEVLTMFHEKQQGQVDVLSPKEFAESEKYLNRAAKNVDKGDSREETLKNLGTAEALLLIAQQNADKIRSQVQVTLDARQKAVSSGAKDSAGPTLKKLDAQFADMNEDLIDGKTLNSENLVSLALENTSLTHQSNQNLFFADINVPTRYFTEGFLTKTNDVLKDDQDTKLIEYFGIKYQSALALSPQDEEGIYEVASLADDGVTMSIFENGRMVPFLNNDGDHPSRLGCNTQRLTMTHNNVVPFELRYYQGPRTHIANMLLWRKVDATTPQDPLCSQFGDSLWFDWQHGSVPQPAFLQLVQRGWRIIAKDNFWIVNNAGTAPTAPGENGILNEYNPCVTGDKPTITNFSAYEILINGAIFKWTTDISSTSQVFITNKATGERVETTSDNLMRTQHILTIQGLLPRTTYTVQALSISMSLGAALSMSIEFTTL